jgi:hypothetical protein
MIEAVDLNSKLDTKEFSDNFASAKWSEKVGQGGATRGGSVMPPRVWFRVGSSLACHLVGSNTPETLSVMMHHAHVTEAPSQHTCLPLSSLHIPPTPPTSHHRR